MASNTTSEQQRQQTATVPAVVPDAAPHAHSSVSRRGFLGQAATGTTCAVAGMPVGRAIAVSLRPADVDGAVGGGAARADRAYAIRVTCARNQRARPLPAQRNNGDERLYATTRIGSFTKGLPHDRFGEVAPAAYAALLRALASGHTRDFDAIPLGGTAKLSDPQGASAFVLEGADSAGLPVAAAPAFSSAQEAAEMAELYWQALARDVPFAHYATAPLIGAAAADLSRLSAFGGPIPGGAITGATIFRGSLPGDRRGPFLSQFLWLPVPYGPLAVAQRYPVAPSRDFMTDYAAWLRVQQGGVSPAQPAPHSRPRPTRYLATGRDLAAYLHSDFSYQAYLNACLILAGLGAPFDTHNPRLHAKTQAGFVTFGLPHVLDLVARVANAALKAVWYQKWLVHRRLRPEEFGGRVHNHMTGAADYPIHADLLRTSGVLSAVYRQHGSYLLPMAYPEGSPLHPAYPAGHMASAGACVTVLKAFFDEAFVLPTAVMASADGHTLLPYQGPALTVGGELNKLASNVAAGRDFSGVHWRSDGAAGLRLGEAVALHILADERATLGDSFGGFSLTTFDGVALTV